MIPSDELNALSVTLTPPPISGTLFPYVINSTNAVKVQRIIVSKNTSIIP